MAFQCNSDDGKTVNKIVVIDDPISGRDSSSMFSSLFSGNADDDTNKAWTEKRVRIPPYAGILPGG